jgi:hypothetical protein
VVAAWSPLLADGGHEACAFLGGLGSSSTIGMIAALSLTDAVHAGVRLLSIIGTAASTGVIPLAQTGEQVDLGNRGGGAVLLADERFDAEHLIEHRLGHLGEPALGQLAGVSS